MAKLYSAALHELCCTSCGFQCSRNAPPLTQAPFLCCCAPRCGRQADLKAMAQARVHSVQHRAQQRLGWLENPGGGAAAPKANAAASAAELDGEGASAGQAGVGGGDGGGGVDGGDGGGGTTGGDVDQAPAAAALPAQARLVNHFLVMGLPLSSGSGSDGATPVGSGGAVTAGVPLELDDDGGPGTLFAPEQGDTAAAVAAAAIASLSPSSSSSSPSSPSSPLSASETVPSLASASVAAAAALARAVTALAAVTSARFRPQLLDCFPKAPAKKRKKTSQADGADLPPAAEAEAAAAAATGPDGWSLLPPPPEMMPMFAFPEGCRLSVAAADARTGWPLGLVWPSAAVAAADAAAAAADAAVDAADAAATLEGESSPPAAAAASVGAAAAAAAAAAAVAAALGGGGGSAAAFAWGQPGGGGSGGGSGGEPTSFGLVLTDDKAQRMHAAALRVRGLSRIFCPPPPLFFLFCDQLQPSTIPIVPTHLPTVSTKPSLSH